MYIEKFIYESYKAPSEPYYITIKLFGKPFKIIVSDDNEEEYMRNTVVPHITQKLSINVNLTYTNKNIDYVNSVEEFANSLESGEIILESIPVYKPLQNINDRIIISMIDELLRNFKNRKSINFTNEKNNQYVNYLTVFNRTYIIPYSIPILKSFKISNKIERKINEYIEITSPNNAYANSLIEVVSISIA